MISLLVVNYLMNQLQLAALEDSLFYISVGPIDVIIRKNNSE